MKTNVLANYIAKTDTNQTFAIDLTEYIADDQGDIISYVVLISNLSADSAYDEGLCRTFKIAENADKYIQSFFEEHHPTLDDDWDARTVESAERMSETGIKHQFDLVRRMNIWKSGSLDVTYEVVHSWGEMVNGEICDSDHGYYVKEFDTIAAARTEFDYYTKEEYPDND